MVQKPNLLLFNLVTDRDDPILGFTTDWINALAPYYRQIFVVTMAKGTVAVAPNVEVHSVGKEKGYSEPKRLFTFYRTIKEILDRETIDVCFVHMISLFAILFFPLARLRGIPVLLWYAHGAVPLTLRIAHKLVDRAVTSSHEGFRLKSNKLKVVGQGINTDIFKPADQGKETQLLRLLTVGRLSPVKHCEILINAVKEVVCSGSWHISYTLIGGPLASDPSDYEKQLKELVKKNNLQEIVNFNAPVPFYTIPSAYQKADLFLNASSTGSLDKAVLEAMSSGCLVITSNPAYKTMLTELAEFLFVPENDPRLFAAAIKKVLTLAPAERKHLAYRLREVVINNHSLKRLTALLVKELASLKSSRGMPG